MLIEKRVFKWMPAGITSISPGQGNDAQMHAANKGANTLQWRSGLITIPFPPCASLGARALQMKHSGLQLASLPFTPILHAVTPCAKNIPTQCLVQ